MRKSLIGVILVLILVIALTPRLASTPLVKPIFVYLMARKSHAEIQIDSLKFSWFGPQIFRGVSFRRDRTTGFFEQLQIDAPFWSFSGPFRLINGRISHEAARIEKIEAQIDGNDFSLTGTSLQGRILLKGQIYSKRRFYIQIDVQQFPLILLDLDPILGPTLNLSGSVQMESGKGAVDLIAEALNVKGHLKGILTETGIWLSEPLDVSFQLTPAMGSFLLKDANPLFITEVASIQTATLRIDPKGFIFPLPYTIKNLKIPNANLDLGRLRCGNEEALSLITALIKPGLLANVSETNIWFAPFSFQLENGVITTNRLDALIADSIHICVWGKIDIIRDKLDMTLGFPADTLEKYFGLRDLPKNYVLKIPVQGTTKKPEIDKAGAAAKIAEMIAISKAGVFEILNLNKDQKDTPTQSNPLPWQSHFELRNAEPAYR